MRNQPRPLSRRRFLTESYLGLGGLALVDMLAADAASAAPKLENPLAVKQPHHPAKAKNCIFLFMEGGVSQMDTFEYKPVLDKLAGQQMPSQDRTVGEINTFAAAPNRIIPSYWPLKQHGESGRWVTDLLPNLATRVDDLAFIHGIKVDNNNHGPAVYHTLTGSQFPGSASIGAWATYGLGSENQDLPGFIVLGDRRGATIGGANVWGNGFLPAAYQGTLFRNGDTPIVDLNRREGITQSEQRSELDLLRWFNEKHAAERSDTGELEARIASYELAFRMQVEAPELVDLTGETDATRKLYGLDDPDSQKVSYGRQALLARRLVEKGVRFIELSCLTENIGAGGAANPWDQHGDLEKGHRSMAYQVDQPIAGLIKDLKSRGLLDQTLIVFTGEFGRTPFSQGSNGRDHNPFGFSLWMAGAGIKPGTVYGATDQFGYKAIENVMEMHDLHATLLHLLGIDHKKLTYRFSGRDIRLTDVHGRVVQELLA